jgi:two-component system, OmpR family, sensor kinase
MFTTLYSKLAAALLGLFALVAAVAVVGTLHVLNLYSLESSQKLNLTLARHLAAQNLPPHLLHLDAGKLREMFDMQMMINPAIQIYLLDRTGQVVSHADERWGAPMRPVALAPMLAFLAPGAKFPILGDDPRHPGERRIFSVAPIPREGEPEGYLYVVLANPVEGGIARALSDSYVFKLAAGGATLAIVLALLMGLFIFAAITRKLTRLAEAMDRFRASDFTERPNLPPSPQRARGDEIDRLGLALRELAARVVFQVQKLKQTDVLRRELVANVSHDLKTPLASLQGYVDTLLLKDDVLAPEERRNYLGVASRSCERLAKLVSDLIDLAKLDAQEVTPQLEPFSVGELLQDVAQKFQLKAEQRRVRLEIVLPPRSPYVSADIGLIERVLENLIGNALAHTPAGGTIALGVELDAAGALVLVRDTGTGIPEDEIPHVFERFYRVNGASWEQGGNAGLGLAITKSILDLHGSRMRVESKPGSGTCFTFSLPEVKLPVAA